MRVLRNQRGQGPWNQKVVFTTFWWYKYHLACSTKNPEIQGVSRHNFIGRPVAGMKYIIGEVGFQREQQAEEILAVFARFSLRILTICHFGGGLCHIKRRPRRSNLTLGGWGIKVRNTIPLFWIPYHSGWESEKW